MVALNVIDPREPNGIVIEVIMNLRQSATPLDSSVIFLSTSRCGRYADSMLTESVIIDFSLSQYSANSLQRWPEYPIEVSIVLPALLPIAEHMISTHYLSLENALPNKKTPESLAHSGVACSYKHPFLQLETG